MKTYIKNKIIPCTNITCNRGTLCPNFTPKYVKQSFTFSSCMYHYLYLTKYPKETNDQLICKTSTP